MKRKRQRHAVAPAFMATLRQAMQAHQAGDLDTAERLYGEVLATRVAQPDALHYLGVLHHQRGQSDEAVRLIEAALQIAPRYSDAHNNLGNVHKECGRLAEAEACYRHALQYAPGRSDALCNLGVTLSAQGRVDEALATYAELARCAPDHAYGHYLRGILLLQRSASRDDLEQSVECLRKATRLNGKDAKALEALGVSLYVLGRRDEARQLYREWLQREPANPVPRHMLAATGGGEVPARADDAYVRETFDQFADSFDEQLLQELDYHAPQVLVETLRGALAPGSHGLDVLDAGCGTGLCAPLLKPLARHLEGVDLSGGMVAKARARGGYDELAVGELTAHLAARRHAYDVVVSADTLIYFGDLSPVMRSARTALREGGWLAFTLEALEGPDDRFELASSGRYRHTRGCVERVLAAAGFDEVRLARAALRKELGKPVPGWVVLARHRAGGAA